MTNILTPNESPALILKDIVKIYGTNENSVTALKGINLNFRKNEFVSVLGHSGCGKTTLLNIVGGLDRYTSGDLIIEGRSTKNYNDKDWDAYRNNCIGFVFQSYNLIPHQTVLANVELALKLSGIAKKEVRNRALAILERVGLTDQIYKKPTQLSGGQMQRVAIARALVNNPEIILADEPTGALDTETSLQIMELLKEIAKDKLVIMVTHNPEIAQKYSNRIIRLVDGEVVGDSNPFLSQELPPQRKMIKPKMGFKTAFMLSLKNLFSKKARTILTSVAGSIGIIGVALVLALSNGFSSYMTKMQTDTLSSYPLTISESSVDLSSFSNIYEEEIKDKYAPLDNVFVKKAFSKLEGMLSNNKLDDATELGFIHYLEQADRELYYDISYGYGFDMNDYFYTDVTMNGKTNFMAIDMLVGQIESQYESDLQSALNISTSFVRQYIPTIQEMPNSKELVESQYDLLYGKMPTFESKDYNQMVLVVDAYNSISDITLALLGYVDININENSNDGTFKVTFGEKSILSLEEALGKQIYLACNDQMYTKYNGIYFNNPNITKEGLEELEIVGILRPKPNSNGILREGFAYTSALTEHLLEQNKDSEIVNTAKQNGGGVVFSKPSQDSGMVNSFMTIRQLAGVLTPATVNIYAKNFEAKEQIKAYINDWNDLHADDESLQITYSDMMGMMFGMLSTMVDAVTYVLVAFTSISLVVSSVMIGIITYISVVERTKEIGVLRALGASKKEISSVFNAETFIIGLCSGLFGVGVAYLITIPINILISGLVPEVGTIAVLSPIAALILVLISISLTLIAGLIPSRIASKKDPVVALRTE